MFLDTASLSFSAKNATRNFAAGITKFEQNYVMSIKFISGSRKAEGTSAEPAQSAAAPEHAPATLPPAVPAAAPATAPAETPGVALPPVPFLRALNFVREWEGGLSTDQTDRANRGGKKTMFGITQKTFNAWRKKLGTKREPVEKISSEEADEIYLNEYWKLGGCETMSADLSMVHMDACVNHGKKFAAKLLQRALNTLPGNDLVVDGKIGDKTRGAILRTDERQLLAAYIGVREHYYREESRPDTRSVNLGGWLNRMAALKIAVGLEKPDER